MCAYVYWELKTVINLSTKDWEVLVDFHLETVIPVRIGTFRSATMARRRYEKNNKKSNASMSAANKRASVLRIPRYNSYTRKFC